MSFAEGTVLGAWRVIGHRGEDAVVVDDASPTLRFRLARVIEEWAEIAEAIVEPTHPDALVGHAGTVEADGARYWVLDDVDAWPLREVVTEPFPAELAVARVLLEDLASAPSGSRRITPGTIVLDRRGRARLLPAPVDPRFDAPEAVGADVVYWLIARHGPPRWNPWAPPIHEARPDLPRPLLDILAELSVWRGVRFGDWARPLAAHLPPITEARARVVEAMSRFAPTVPATWLRELSRPEPVVVLPAALDPWRDVLSLFPAELALSLGDAVRKVSRVLGPLSLEAEAAQGVPDGYRGVTRRGTIDRLLISEWALALEIPEEFLRRAAMKEQLHHALAYVEPGGTRRSIALFCAGPRSLGRPRVAQLAVLVALAARARAAGVPFAWGVLQDGRRGQIGELSAASVRRFLDARTPLEATAIDGAEWAISLGAPSENADDLWLVGPPGIEQAVELGGGTRVVLEDRGDRLVELRLSRARGAARELALELPPEEHTVRLLREPFHAARSKVRAPRAGGRLTGALAVAATGRVAVVGIETDAGPGVVAVALPRNARESTPTPITRVLSPGSELVGACYANKRLHTLERDERGLALWRFGPAGGAHRAWPLATELELEGLGERGGPWHPCVIAYQGRELGAAWVLGEGGALWVSGPWRVDRRGVFGVASVARGLLVGSLDEAADLRLELVWSDGAQLLDLWRPWRSDDEDFAPAMVLGVGAARMPGDGVAVKVGVDRWAYGSGRGGRVFEARPGARVVACAMIDGVFQLLSVEDERVVMAGDRVLHRFDAPIVSAAANPDWPTLVVVDARGRLSTLGLDGEIGFETRYEGAP